MISSSALISPSNGVLIVTKHHFSVSKFCSTKKNDALLRIKHCNSEAGVSTRLSVQAKATENTSTVKRKSILCSSCEGNGMIQCSQCKGSGINSVDHFNGRFKAGTTCWLCRGKKEMLCGDCNGAGFLGGFMTTPEE